MPTYVNTIIYKICCKDRAITDMYIGHTTNFKQRQIEHRYNYRNEHAKSHKLRVYECIRSNGGIDNWEFVQIEEYPCDTKKQASCRENYWVFELKATLNVIMPILDIANRVAYNKRKSDEMKLETIQRLACKKEERLKYLEDHKGEIQQHKTDVRREYEKKNRDRINAAMREYNQTTRERRAELSHKSYEKRKSDGYYEKIKVTKTKDV